jgi:hypothetical protein
MRILCIYFQSTRRLRNTVREHLSSFQNYSGADCYYLNVAHGIPRYINRINFDLIIFHYTFLALKWDIKEFKNFQNKCSRLKYISGYKIAFPQDEYIYSAAVSNFFKEFSVKTVFTCLPLSECKKVYDPQESGLKNYFTVLTGYIDSEAVKSYSGKALPLSERKVDVGYRGRKVPFWLGQQGQIKWQLCDRFKEILAVQNTLRYDISWDRRDEITGYSWYDFLSRCRVILGCEGGASLHDPTGEIRIRVEQFLHRYPSALFEEVQAKCLADVDGNLNLRAISPRHFECCVTKTCQALVEGAYGGIFKPGVHYIEIKKDWSNLEDVLSKIKDVKYCQEIADNAYRDIVEPGLYSYEKFIEQVMNSLRKELTHNSALNDDNLKDLKRLRIREQLNPLFLYYLSPYYKLRGGLRRIRNVRQKVSLPNV